MRLGRVRESDVLKGSSGCEISFMPSDRPKMVPGWRRESDFSRGRQGPANWFFSLCSSKMWLGRATESVEFNILAILGTYILPSGWPKMRLGNFEKAMFQVVEGPGISFLPFGHHGMRLGWGRESDVSRGRLRLRKLFLPNYWPKIRVGRGRESDVSRDRKALKYHFLPSDHP
jgi:hypothetical protein